jgi:hypothetical protein
MSWPGRWAYGPDPADRGVVRAEALGDAGAVVLQQDVRLGHEAVQQPLAARGLKVDGQAALVPVERQE